MQKKQCRSTLHSMYFSREAFQNLTPIMIICIYKYMYDFMKKVN